MASAERTVKQAKKWVGYLEKASNSQLDDFRANAGSANYTRFGRDFGYNPGEWCGMFVSMVFKYEYGDTEAKRLLCGGYHSYTPSGAQFFKEKGRYIKRGHGTPKSGDVIFFYSTTKGRIGHVGIVTGVKNGTVYTIEGNSRSGAELVTNGGAVVEKSYPLTSTYIDGYGSVDYGSAEQPKNKEKGKTVMVELKQIKKGSSGAEVKTIQRLLKSMGYKDQNGKGLELDSDFGSKTDYAVRAFQKAKGLSVDGVVGKNTWEKLLK